MSNQEDPIAPDYGARVAGCPWSGSPPRVIVVDDDPVVLKVAHDLLARFDADVTSLSDGRAACELARGSEFDVVVTDIFMPEYDGFELIRDLRRHKTGVGIVAMSAGNARCSEFDILMMATKLGADDWLAKPFGVADFVDVVRSVADKARARRD